MAHEIILGNKSYLVSDRLTQDKAASQFRVLEDHAETTARAWGKACAEAHPEGIEISPRWHPAIQDEILRTGRWKETPYASEERTWREQWKIGWAIAWRAYIGLIPLYIVASLFTILLTVVQPQFGPFHPAPIVVFGLIWILGVSARRALVYSDTVRDAAKRLILEGEGRYRA